MNECTEKHGFREKSCFLKTQNDLHYSLYSLLSTEKQQCSRERGESGEEMRT